jgi:HEAT repeat protein
VQTGSAGDGLEGFELQLAKIVELPNRDDRVNALKLLEGCDNLSPEITKRIIPLTTSTDPEIAFAAMAVLLKSGTAADVERVRKYVRTYSTDSAPISVVGLASELGQVHDEAAWPALCDLSRSPLLSIRIGSMQALRRIRGTQAAPCLIERLDDSNSYVSYLGLITLAETFEKYGDYAPNMELFDGNRRFYVSLWKAWWLENGQTYQGGSTSK